MKTARREIKSDILCPSPELAAPRSLVHWHLRVRARDTLRSWRNRFRSLWTRYRFQISSIGFTQRAVERSRLDRHDCSEAADADGHDGVLASTGRLG